MAASEDEIKLLGEKLGFTDKSGRRKLQQLREQRPDLFEEGDDV